MSIFGLSFLAYLFIDVINFSIGPKVLPIKSTIPLKIYCACVFLQETLSAIQLVGVVVTMSAVMLISHQADMG
jgi:uncharacterized membrane protein